MKRVVDRVLWTATGTAIGFGLCLLATFIYFREAWL